MVVAPRGARGPAASDLDDGGCVPAPYRAVFITGLTAVVVATIGVVSTMNASASTTTPATPRAATATATTTTEGAPPPPPSTVSKSHHYAAPHAFYASKGRLPRGGASTGRRQAGAPPPAPSIAPTH